MVIYEHDIQMVEEKGVSVVRRGQVGVVVGGWEELNLEVFVADRSKTKLSEKQQAVKCKGMQP